TFHEKKYRQASTATRQDVWSRNREASPMRFSVRRALLLAAGLCLPGLPLLAAVPSTPLVDELSRQAPKLDKKVLYHALSAMQCAVNNGANPAERLAVIVFSLPSSERRLWIFDLQSKRLLLKEYVAHGNRSGGNQATAFSNRVGSHQSSLGLFRTAESYRGKHGYRSEERRVGKECRSQWSEEQ